MTKKILIALFISLIVLQAIFAQIEGKEGKKIINQAISHNAEKKETIDKSIQNWENSCSGKWLEKVNSFCQLPNLQFEKIGILPEYFLDINPAGIFYIDKDILKSIDREKEYFRRKDILTQINLKDFIRKEVLLLTNCFVPLALIQVYVGEEKIDWWNFTIAQPYIECCLDNYEPIEAYFEFVDKSGKKRELPLPNYAKELKVGEILFEREKNSGAIGIIHKREWEIYDKEKKIFQKEEVFIRCIFLQVPEECEKNKKTYIKSTENYDEFMYYVDLYRRDMELYQKEIQSQNK
ncbi:MAG: hypothetical protein GYA35_03215 [Thermoanaerobaculaceae bacterium]|nr:hypothetical protein [Thermoanaerobaculaceae bacterium]